MDRDRTRVIDAYRSVLEIDSLDRTALNNLALRLNQSRDWDEAELLTRRGLAHHNIYSLYTHLLVALVAQGKYGAADSAMDRMAETRGPLDPYVLRGRGWIAAVQADYASADAYLDSLGAGADGAWEDYVSNMRSRYATIGGRIERARQLFEGRMEGAAQRGEGGSYLDEAVRRARVDLEIREQPASAVASVEEALRRIPLRTIPSVDRPYLALITLFADAGRVDDAVRLMTEYETEVPETFRRGESGRLAAAGAIALAEGRIDEAIASYRAFVASPRNCVRCGMDRLGQLYDRAGQRDSALAVYERGVTADDLMRPWAWTRTLAPTYRRLGELYEEDGNHERALQYYDLFVETWTSADDDLQPMVADVRSRMARLAGESPR